MPQSPSAAQRLATLLTSLKELGVTDRATHLRVLRQALEQNPRYLSVWAVWEHGALGDDESRFAGTSAHDDEGRFMPTWHRRHGNPCLETCRDFADPVRGAYCQLPMRRRRPVVVGPYEYPFSGEPTMILTLAAPIMNGRSCEGAAGLDYSLESMAASVMQKPADEALSLVETVENEFGCGVLFFTREWKVLVCTEACRRLLAGSGSGLELRPGDTLPTALRLDCSTSTTGVANHVLKQGGTQLEISVGSPLDGGPLVMVVNRTPVLLELPLLSAREEEVMQWLSEGKSNDEIGIILDISPHTVKNHLDRIYKKIGVGNRHAAMLAWAREMPDTPQHPALAHAYA